MVFSAAGLCTCPQNLMGPRLNGDSACIARKVCAVTSLDYSADLDLPIARVMLRIECSTRRRLFVTRGPWASSSGRRLINHAAVFGDIHDKSLSEGDGGPPLKPQPAPDWATIISDITLRRELASQPRGSCDKTEPDIHLRSRVLAPSPKIEFGFICRRQMGRYFTQHTNRVLSMEVRYLDKFIEDLLFLSVRAAA
jgi:hypothetical protein